MCWYNIIEGVGRELSQQNPGDLLSHAGTSPADIKSPGTIALAAESSVTKANDTWELATSSYHYIDVIMGSIASLITSLAIGYSIGYSGADQRKQQRPASLAFVCGIHRWPVNSPHKRPVTRTIFLFDDVIMDWVERDRKRGNWHVRSSKQFV